MASSPLSAVIRDLRRVALLRDGAGLTDSQLLEDFLERHEEAAFELLVRRHGPMVLGVCKRVLRHAQDAEDAFQATFLVLMRKAASITKREMLAAWLYGVAYRIAVRAKVMTAKRRTKEQQMRERTVRDGCDDGPLTDLEPMLDQEVNRLPAKYRVPLVLCELEGKSRRDAARQLGLPEGTLSSRLARARGMLRKRLTARGLALSAGTLALALTPEATAAPLPQALVTTTVKAAALFGAGQAAGGVLSVKAAALALAAMKALLASKLKVGAAVLLAVGLVCAGFGAGWYGYRTLVGQQAASASVPERVAFADHDPPEELMPPPARVEPGEGGTAEGDPEEMQPNAEPMLAEPDEPPAEVTAPPAVLEFDPFYQKHASARGLPVIGSAKVSDKALQEAAYLVNRVLDTRPDVREAMIEAGVYFIVMHESEKTTDLPEQRDLKPKEKWDRVRGLGDRVRNCGEENLLQLPGDRLRGKVVLIHQIAYAMYAEGLDCLDEEFKPRLKELYKDAMARGLWQGTRAVGNQAEYWSEAVASYFGGNRARVRGGDGYVNTREQLAAYDPEVFQLVDEVFRQARWRYQPPDKRENSKPKP